MSDNLFFIDIHELFSDIQLGLVEGAGGFFSVCLTNSEAVIRLFSLDTST